MKCRHCDSDLELVFVDLGTAPPSNAYLEESELHAPEKWYPLRVMVCEACWLVQTEDFTQADELFNEKYAYFSGISKSWLAHAERYVEDMIDRLGLASSSQVVEVAANDGYLLQYFKGRGVPCTGIEPTASTAQSARDKGLDIIGEFFDVELARDLASRGLSADLTVANNVLAHVPDINSFVAGFTVILKPTGTATFEFPHLLNLIEKSQFDTIYHEHFSYLSLAAVETIFTSNGLAVYDVEELPTHGGSLRVYAQRQDSGPHARSAHVDRLLDRERNAGLLRSAGYTGFQEKAEAIKFDFIEFLLDARRQGRTVAGYGAAAKGNTLINFAGVRADLVEFVVDQNPAKQGMFLPGSRIPIVDDSNLRAVKPDYILILPWNLKDELVGQLRKTREWGARFVTFVPERSLF
jgi:SAM-dependent methyltransferase